MITLMFVFLQGMTIKPVVNALKVKRQVEKNPSMSEMLNERVSLPVCTCVTFSSQSFLPFIGCCYVAYFLFASHCYKKNQARISNVLCLFTLYFFII